MNNEVLQDYCKDINSVAEYFLTIGVSDRQVREHLEGGEHLRPEILSQFPPFERPHLRLPEAIELVIPIQFCAPLGLHILPVSADNSIYSIVLTSETGERVYCTCLKTYESYKEDGNNDSFAEITSVPEESLRFFTEDISLYNPNKEPSESKFIPKILVIVSKKPFFRTFSKILKRVYQSSKENLEYPLELVLAHFLFQVPAPSKGHVRVIYELSNQDFIFSVPPCNKLPLLDLNAGTFFSCLDLSLIHI